jgi:hypothetical protein
MLHFRPRLRWSSLARIAPLLALVTVWALWFWRFFAPPGDRIAYPSGDFTNQFVVFRDVQYRSLIAGQFPLWADCLWSGYPIYADPQAQTFYPPIYITFGILRLLEWGHFPVEALTAEVAAHYLALSIFLYAFLRSRALNRSASALGALVFSYSGYLTGYPPLQSVTLAVDTWLPLALLFAGRLGDHGRWRDLVFTTLALALAFLAGHPQTFTYVLLLALGYFAFRHFSVSRSLVTFSGIAIALILLTAGLAAVQLVPSVHFILNSTRASVAFEQAGRGFALEDVLQFLITGYVSYWHPLYIGLLPLGLAGFALARRSRETIFWAMAALLSLILSFGTKAGLYDLTYWLVPGWRLFRGQEHLALITCFALTVLAAFGADALQRALSRQARRALETARRTALAFFGIALLLLTLATLLAWLGFDPSNWRQLPNRAGVMALGAGLTLVTVTLRARVPTLRHWLPGLLIGAAMVDLFAANRPLNVVAAYDPFPPNPLIEPMSLDAGFFRVQDDAQLPGHAGCVHGYRAIEGITPYAIATYSNFLARAPEPVRWQWLGVKYVVSWRDSFQTSAGQALPRNVLASGTIPDEKGNVTKTFLIDFIEPRRAWLARQTVVAPDDETLWRYLANPHLDAREIVFLPEGEASAGTGGGVSVITDRPGNLHLQVTTDEPTVLVVSEAYYPGWRAAVDGREARVLRVNGALIGLTLPAGAHDVVVAFRPTPLWAGVTISVLSFTLALGPLIYRPQRR